MQPRPTRALPERGARAPLWALCCSLIVACTSPTGDPTLTIEVAALDLADIADVCWDLRVTNGPGGSGEVVLSRGDTALASPADTTTLCASRYGQRGDLTFVAPCDASLLRSSSVTVWLDSLWEVGLETPSTSYRDPCEDGCTLDVTCRENADTRATFDITVMRDARQGFFDMAVTFGDVFCAAKADTCDSEGRENLLLFGSDGARLPTAVLAIACIGGPEASAPTQLHAGQVVVACEDQAEVLLDLGAVTQPGNQPPIDGVRWALYTGSESPGGGTATMDYLNVAIATPLASCRVSWQATATEGPSLPGDAATPGLYVYPVIETDEVAITDANGAWLCSQHPLDAPLSLVRTAYRKTTTRGDPAALVSPGGSSWSGGGRVDTPGEPDPGPTDTVAPFVTGLSMPSGGNYIQGQQLTFTVTFSEPVLTSPLRLPIAIGDKPITLTALGTTPSTASIVSFRYTVGPDDLAQTGIAVGPALLTTYTDVAGNPGDPTLPGAGSLPAVRVNDMPLALTAFTPPPDGFYLEGELLTFTVTYNRAVALDDSSGSPTIDFTLGTGTGTARSATYLDGAELGVLRFTYEIVDGENDPDGLAMSVGQVVLNGATLTDTVPVDEDQTPTDAPRTFAVPNLSGIKIDTVSPTLTTLTRPANGTYTLGQTLRTTLTFSEPIIVSGGSPTIELIIGTRVANATLTSGPGTTTFHFDYVVQSGDFADLEDGGVELSELKLNGATLTDVAGHIPNYDVFVPVVWTSVFVDAVAAPTILSVTGPPNGNYRVGESLIFTVTFSESVVITPYLPTANAPPTRPAVQLTVGSTTRYATWIDQGPGEQHVFEYVIASGDLDTNGITLTSPLVIQSTSYPIRSEEWNKDANRTFTPPNLSGVLVENVVNSDAIAITSLSVPTSKYYRNGRVMSFTAYFNRSLTLSATSSTRPRIALRIGDRIRYAESYYLSGTRSSLLMRYTVEEEDEDHDGIEILSSQIELNGGSLTASGNPPIDLTLPTVDTTGVKVDGLLAT
ncbi:MAG TPA: hypothetical protein PK095_11805, partial [Myxococcota bacterium]|nr:hypothetical protein [Myxococcota bacterium]